jgi:hypothetical protein
MNASFFKDFFIKVDLTVLLNGCDLRFHDDCSFN